MRLNSILRIERERIMEVINELLGYPYYKIIQDPDRFNFSIDSVCLAHFVTLKPNAKNVIDLGCGNGPIAMYLTLRTKAHIDAVEIQEGSLDLARRSIKLNMLEDRITLYHDDIRGFAKKYQKKYDVVLSNPPFFKYNETSNINKNDYKTIARHEVMLNIFDLCKEAAALLNDAGVFALVHRPDRLTDILKALRDNRLEPKRIQFIYPKEGMCANHVLIEAVKGRGEGGLKALPPFYVHNSDGSHTTMALEVYNQKDETR